MPQSISTNVNAMSARRFMDINATMLGRAQDQLSSGKIVSDPSQNPSAASVGSVLDAAIQSLAQASSNATQAEALIQLATGTLGATNEILTRMNSLASQANSDTIGEAERSMLDKEFQSLLSQVDQNATVSWGGVQLFSGGAGKSNGKSYGEVFSSTSLASFDTNNSVVPGKIASITSVKGAIDTEMTFDATASAASGDVVTLTVNGEAYTYTHPGAGTDLNGGDDIAFVSTSDSSRVITLKVDAGYVAGDIDTAAKLVTEINSFFPNTSTLAAATRIVGISGEVYGTGGSKASASGSIVSLIVGAQTFTLDMSSGAIASGGNILLTATSGDTITLENGTTVLSADSTGATALAGLLNTYFGTTTTIANSGNGNGVATQSATGLMAVNNAFAGTLNADSAGHIGGAVSDVSVVANGPSYDVKVKVGTQTFAATATPTASGTLVLSSVTDANNKIILDYAGSVDAITNASTFQDALKQTLGITTGSPASFASSSVKMNNAQLKPGAGSLSGNYALSYTVSGNTGTFKLTDGVNIYTVDVDKAASISKTVSFSNGSQLALTAFDGSASLNQTTYNFSAGTAIDMSFQIGQKSTDTLSLTFTGMKSSTLGLSGLNVNTKDKAAEATTKILAAMAAINSQIATLGGKKSQIGYLNKNLAISIQNQMAAKSTFTDADVTQALMDTQQYQALVNMSSTMFQQTLQKQQQLAQLVQSVTRG